MQDDLCGATDEIEKVNDGLRVSIDTFRHPLLCQRSPRILWSGTYTIHANGTRDPFLRLTSLRIPEPSEDVRLEERIELKSVLLPET